MKVGIFIMPKKRTLPYIILGILAQKDEQTGRQITLQFQNEIGEFWKAAHSQIYPELKKMVADDWIEKQTHAGNDKEIYYRLTPKGQAELSDWITQPIDELPVSQDIFSLKLFFIQEATDPRIKTMIAEERALLKKQLAHLKEREHLLFDGHVNQGSYGHYLILKRAIARLKSQLVWLDTVEN